MSYVIVYRACTQEEWIPFSCASGRFQFDAVEACNRARGIALLGMAEVEIHPVGAEGRFARFFLSVTGEIMQEGGCDF